MTSCVSTCVGDMSPFWLCTSDGDSWGTALRGESWLVGWSGDRASLLSSSKDELSPPAPFGESVTESGYFKIKRNNLACNEHLWPVKQWTWLLNLEICECKAVEHNDDCLMDCLTVMTNFREVIQHCTMFQNRTMSKCSCCVISVAQLLVKGCVV